MRWRDATEAASLQCCAMANTPAAWYCLRPAVYAINHCVVMMSEQKDGNQLVITSSPGGVRSIVTSMSGCLSVCPSVTLFCLSVRVARNLHRRSPPKSLCMVTSVAVLR